ncbi:MAG: hypothetical protein ACXIVD_07695 [Salinarimonas sp.]
MSISLNTGQSRMPIGSLPQDEQFQAFRLPPSYGDLAPHRRQVDMLPASTLPSVWPPGSNRPDAPALEDVKLQSNEYGAIPVDRIDPSQLLHFDTAAASIANDIEKRRADNPNFRLAVMGEEHSDLSEAIYQFTAHYLRTGEIGSDLIQLIESPTTPYVDDLIDKLYDGDIDEDEFLARGSVALQHQYLAALINHENETGETVDDPGTIDTFRRMLERDVIRNYRNDARVVLVDRNRFTFDESGQNADRTRGLEEAVREAMERYPDNFLLLQVGKLHVIPDFVTNSEIAEAGVVLNGVPGGRIPSELSLLHEFTEQFGDDMHAYIGVQYRESGSGYNGVATEPNVPVLLNMDPIEGREYDVEATRARMREAGNCAQDDDDCWAFTSLDTSTFYMYTRRFYREPLGREPGDPMPVPE